MPLWRKAFAEFLGSALLAAAVVGSGIAAQRLSPHDTGLQLLENSLITGAVLVALILALGPVSAAFHPAVTLAERAVGAITTKAAAGFIAAQTVGCCVGVMIANLMFGIAAVNLSHHHHHRTGGGLWLVEVIATFGLLVVIFGVVRAGRSSIVAFAVGGYITAAYWFTSSTSFANPGITVGRTLSDTFAGIAPSSVPMFVLMQLLGAALAVGAGSSLSTPTPAPSPPTSSTSTMSRSRRSVDQARDPLRVRHNGGRSLAAKVLTEHHAQGTVEVRSAGSEPGNSLNPAVVHVLHEMGLSTEDETPKLLTYDSVQAADIVITMGCGETCPRVPRQDLRRLDLERPSGPGHRRCSPDRARD